MKKVLLVMCFLGAANLFAESNLCPNIVFQKDSGQKVTAAYIKADVVPALETFCESQDATVLLICNIIDFESNGSAWIASSALESVYTYCTTEPTTQEDESYWASFVRGASNVIYHH